MHPFDDGSEYRPISEIEQDYVRGLRWNYAVEHEDIARRLAFVPPSDNRHPG